MKKKPWSESEIAYLKIVYSDSYTNDIAKSLDRKPSMVYQKAAALGLKKSDKFLEKELQRQANRLKESGQAHRFQKGETPFNKGKRMKPEVYEKVKSTMFQKGLMPHNTKYDGHERIAKDGFIEIRIRSGKYVLKHRWEWEKVNGKIPENHILRCIDGNQLNTDPSNWKLISRSENMKLNTIHRFPSELKKTIKVLSTLKKTLNEKQD